MGVRSVASIDALNTVLRQLGLLADLYTFDDISSTEHVVSRSPLEQVADNMLYISLRTNIF